MDEGKPSWPGWWMADNGHNKAGKSTQEHKEKPGVPCDWRRVCVKVWMMGHEVREQLGVGSFRPPGALQGLWL